MKIIDLLNKIANGEQLPKFKNEKIEQDFSLYVYNNWGDTYNLEDLKKILNDEVEIIKEDNKIEKFEIHSLGYKDKYGNYVDSPFPTNEELMNKINEIIDKVNKIGSE